MTKVAPKVGEVYRCSVTPSGYILVTFVRPPVGMVPGFVTGWGDGHGHTASAQHVVPFERLRNTKRRGPFSGISKERALDAPQGGPQPT